jgi:hypothetical protein
MRRTGLSHLGRSEDGVRICVRFESALFCGNDEAWKFDLNNLHVCWLGRTISAVTLGNQRW